MGITAVPRNIDKKCLCNFFFLGGGGGGQLISLIIGNVEGAYGRIALAVATLGPLIAFRIRDFPCLNAEIRDSGFRVL